MSPFVAEITESLVTGLAQLGLGGAMLAWFMTKHAESMKQHGEKLDKFGAKMDRMVNAMLLETCTRENVSPAIRSRAEQMLNDDDGR